LLAVGFDYSRGGRQVSLRRRIVGSGSWTLLGAIGLLAALPACSQYTGQAAKSAKDAPELRAIAVLEWTGEPGKPKKSRLVPVAVLDGGELQDGAIYLARPQPLALAGEVEYELQQNGKPVGLFDIKNTGQEQGSWVGYGSWKGMPVARPKPSALELARSLFQDDSQSDVPVLHRKHHADDPATGGSASGGDSGKDRTAPAPTSDPDRPTLHKKSTPDSAGNAGAANSSASTAGDPNKPAAQKSSPGKDSSDSATNSTSPSTNTDPDRPTLHKNDTDKGSSADDTSSTAPSASSDPDRPKLHKKSSDDAGASSGPASDDPDRPVMKKTKKKKQEDVGYSEGLAGVTDPDRPRLKRGLASSDALNVVPSLMGLPPDMQQAVAVSDAKTRPEHTWSYSWADPEDEERMKLSLEGIARNALGLNPPPPPPAPATKASATRRGAKAAPPPPAPLPPAPAPLLDEQFRVFELAYGSGATLVLTAHSDGPLAQQKFIALVAQPDLYGNTLVLLKSTTDGAHLDETPRMRLVDAVDAMADNRGELLFELRGSTQRQFALYRILRGQAERLFVGGGGEFGIEGRY
jgi:hypothetical protein